MDALVLLACCIVLGFCYFLMKRMDKPVTNHFIRVEMMYSVDKELTVQNVDWEIKRTYLKQQRIC